MADINRSAEAAANEAALRAASLAAQAASTVESGFDILGGLPRGSARRALDPEIAGEGGKVSAEGKVILSDGSQVTYTAPSAKLMIPDISGVKSIQHYFQPRGYQPYPAWLYHPTKPEILVKDAREAAELGIVYRKTTEDERMRFGRNDMWDWEQGCQWRPRPWADPKVNVKDHAGTKNIIVGAPDQMRVQHDLVASVAAAVAQVLKLTPGAASPPPAIDPRQWDEFIAFQAWKKASEVVGAELNKDDPEGEVDAVDPQINALSPEQDRTLWEEEARRLGLKPDGRWSMERLKSEVQKATDKA